MRQIGTANVTRGSIAWTNPLRLKISIFPAKTALAAPAVEAEPAKAAAYTIDRDRIFDYVKKHRLPSERARQIRRDARNSVDFIADVRDLQTPGAVEPL